jgi:hypothetical protein
MTGETQMPDTKPGYKTTEFWMTLLGVLVPLLLPNVSPTESAGLAAAVVAVYTAARSIVKAKTTTTGPVSAEINVKS